MDAGELQLALPLLLGGQAGRVVVVADGKDLDERGASLVEGVPGARVVVFALLVALFAFAFAFCLSSGTFVLLGVPCAVLLVRGSITSKVELVVARSGASFLLGCSGGRCRRGGLARAGGRRARGSGGGSGCM